VPALRQSQSRMPVCAELLQQLQGVRVSCVMSYMYPECD
jgi:hypothetical protein